MIGWQAALTSGCYVCGTLLQGFIELIRPDYDTRLWHTTLLTYAALAHQNGTDMLQLLLERGKTDLCATNVDGWTALHEASYQGPLAVVKILLSHGADRNARTKTDHQRQAASLRPVDLSRFQAEHGLRS